MLKSAIIKVVPFDEPAWISPSLSQIVHVWVRPQHALLEKGATCPCVTYMKVQAHGTAVVINGGRATEFVMPRLEPYGRGISF
jgi:hypothetical protein